MTSSSAVEHKASYERIFRTGGLRDEPFFYRWILAWLRPVAGARLLDVACGEGGVLLAAHGRRPWRHGGVDAYGVDVSEGAVRTAVGSNGGVRAVVGDAERLPWMSASFDYVTCLGSLENFRHLARALVEIRRVLKDGGVLCVMMPNKYWLGDVLNVARGRDEQIPFQDVERLATPVQWRRVLEAQGFTVTRMAGYVKRAPLFRDGKLRSIRKWLWTRLLALVSPATLAWSVVYRCEKGAMDAAAPGSPAWLWRAEWLKPSRS